MNAYIINIPREKQPYSKPIDSQPKRYSKFVYFQKRVVDFLLSSMLILASMPIIAVIVIRIKKESPGPIFFKQTRIGLHGKRYIVRPGITGLAQVSYPYGRDIYDTEQKLDYDFKCIKHWSLYSELKILIQTVNVVLSKKGI